MADLKISQLGSIVTVVPATDVLPVVQGGTTYKITPNQILGSGGTATLASATITGDLTVDTSTLKVDSTNNRVGIGTATPADTLDVNGRVTALRYLSSSSNAALPSFAVSAGNGAYNSGTNEIGFSINSTSAMTLNSTGLGIGTSPTSKLSLLDASPRINFVTSAGLDITGYIYNAIDVGSGGKLVFGTKRNGNTTLDFMTLDSSGNLILSSSNTPATLAANGQLTVNATSDTNLRFSYRGSDGTTRVANITLA
jgi:hypothetical protein